MPPIRLSACRRSTCPHAADTRVRAAAILASACRRSWRPRGGEIRSELNAALRRPAESRTLDAQARLYAAIALAQRGDPSQVPAVIAALNGSESGPRENAVARVFAAHR